ncbi:putative immunity protein [Deinococcus sp.]|uniref:putative immunity protein n=1 Tax=Deinococcus sp. TaxID=47478 RepID=UPI00344D2321
MQQPIARAWTSGQATMTEARKAAVAAHTVARGAAARETANPVAVAVARAVGHAVATAHLADHSLSSVRYAL